MSKIYKLNNNEVIENHLAKPLSRLERTITEPIHRLGQGIKKLTLGIFKALITIVISIGLLSLYFGYRAYNGYGTPFDKLEMIALQDNLADVSAGLAKVYDDDLLLRIDAIEKDLLDFHKTLKNKKDK